MNIELRRKIGTIIFDGTKSNQEELDEVEALVQAEGRAVAEEIMDSVRNGWGGSELTVEDRITGILERRYGRNGE